MVKNHHGMFFHSAEQLSLNALPQHSCGCSLWLWTILSAVFEQHRFSFFHFMFTECLGLFSYKVLLDNLKVLKCVDTSNRSVFPYQKYHFSCQIRQERSTGWVRPSGSWLSTSLLLLLTLVVTQLLSLHWQMRFHHILNSLQRKMSLKSPTHCTYRLKQNLVLFGI